MPSFKNKSISVNADVMIRVFEHIEEIIILEKCRGSNFLDWKAMVNLLIFFILIFIEL